MKNYIFGIFTGFIILVLFYFLLGGDIFLDKKYGDLESLVITGDVVNNEDNNPDYLTQGFPIYTGLTDITHEIQGQFYNPYSPYLLNEIGRSYSFSGMILGLLHNNVLSMINGEEWLGWQPWFTIKDAGKECHRGNRITGLIQEENKLIMTVLDRCGGGSMDGYVSSYELESNGKRVLNGCYNYDNWSSIQKLAPEEYQDGNLGYYRVTRQLGQLPKEPLETCDGNIEIEYYR